MPDIALLAGFDPVTRFPVFDIAFTPIPEGAEAVARDVDLDSGLNTAVFLSLFTDARANSEEVRDPNDLRGWWGDEFGPMGSKLWLLLHGKATDEAVANAKTWTEEALAWLISGGVAESVTATAVRVSLYAITISIQIQRPKTSASTFRYALNWAATV